MDFANNNECGEANRVWIEPFRRIVTYEDRYGSDSPHRIMRCERFTGSYEWRSISKDRADWQVEKMYCGKIKGYSPDDANPMSSVAKINLFDGSEGLHLYQPYPADHPETEMWPVLMGEAKAERIGGRLWAVRVDLDYTLKSWRSAPFNSELANEPPIVGWISWLKYGRATEHKEFGYIPDGVQP